MGPLPLEHWIGRISEEFGGALPSVVLRERARLPLGMLETIVEYRNYAAAKADYDRDPATRADASALRQLVQIIEFELAAEEIEESPGP